MTLDIMMPFYGRVDHFKEAVKSVLAQTSPDWRLVIVDDVYPDPEPGRWAQAIGDARVTYVRNEANLRPSRNYQKCVGLMRTEFAVLMGCDDLMLPNYVTRLHELIAEFPQVSMIQPGVITIDADGNRNNPLADRVKRLYQPRGQRPVRLSGERLARSLLRGNWTYFPSLAWRVSELQSRVFREDLDVVQDLAMLVSITRGGGSLVLDDQVCFKYRRHATSVSAVTGPDGSKFAQERTLFDELSTDLARQGWSGAARAARVHLSSRLHAATQMPAALRASEPAGRRALLRHVFGR